jgi:methyl coenzyme M reductase gamma subunit
LAETGSMRSMNIETDVTLDRVEVVFGADECAATQTVHFADSVAFRWLCETNAIADQNVSNIHSHATGLDHDRIMAALLSRYDSQIYTEAGHEGNKSARLIN